VILDLGANRGDFARGLQARFGCQVRLVEANPDLFAKLKFTAEFPVLHAAAAAQSGKITFNIAHNDEGSSMHPLPGYSQFGCTHSRSVEVEALTLVDIMAQFGLGHLHLLKLDVEGAEVGILESCPPEVLQRIDQITVEFHCAPVFGFGGRDRVESVMRRLSKLGFSRYIFEDDYTDVAFIAHRNLGTSLTRRMLLAIGPGRPRWLDALWHNLPAWLRGAIRRLLGPRRE
jgi:FkbM family methyltransferase